VPDGEPGWLPATRLLSDDGPAHDRRGLDDLLDAAKQRWGASPHVAAALAWRSYTYWLAMPVVIGWAVARRVPLLDPADVLVRMAVTHDQPLLTMGLRRVRMAVLPGDPTAGDVTVVESDAALLRVLRTTLRDRHLDRLLERIRDRVNLGARTMLGSLASAIAYGVVRGVDAPAAQLTAATETLLATLDVPDLVDLQPGPDGRLEVRRRTCCLAFTLPEPKICSGCCLQPQ
jgi:hypothetical protein